MQGFSDWLYDTPVSVAFKSIPWLIPVVQSIHILAITVIAGAALMLDFRLLGVVGRREPVPAFVNRYAPWLFTALGVLLLSGLVLVIAEPDQTLTNTVFWIKMGLVVLAAIATWLIVRPVRSQPDYWEGKRLGLARAGGLISLVLWVSVVVCGRWIAYS